MIVNNKLPLTVTLPGVDVDYNIALGLGGYLLTKKPLGALLGFGVLLLSNDSTEEVPAGADENSATT